MNLCNLRPILLQENMSFILYFQKVSLSVLHRFTQLSKGMQIVDMHR